MGINSTEVSYGYGQFGSAYLTNSSANTQFFAPAGLVIVAITGLTKGAGSGGTDGVTFTNGSDGLVPEKASTGGSGAEYVNTVYEANHFGDTSSTGTTSGVSTTTLTIGAANANIKPGMIINSNENTSIKDIPFSLSDPTTVVAYDGATTVTMSKAHTVASTTIAFRHPKGVGLGVGGEKANNSMVVPSGATIFGRWKACKIKTGSCIVYFGE